MEVLSAFPDAEDIGLELLAPAGPTRLTTPSTLTTPLIVVRHTGGVSDWITDIPRLQVEAFGSSHRQAVDLAERCRQLILASPATGAAGTSIDRAWVESSPSYMDYGVQNIHWHVATYRLAYRRSR